MSDAAAECPVCASPITNPPAWIDLPGGQHSVMVHEGCAAQPLSASQLAALQALFDE